MELLDNSVVLECRSDGANSIGTALNAITIPFRFNEAQLFVNCSTFSVYQQSARHYIKEITFPDTLTTIAGYWYQDASALVKVVVPASVTRISGQGAFRRCPSLESFICYAETPPSMSYSNTFSNTSCVIYVPNSSVEAYKSAANWSVYASMIKPLSEYQDS